MKIEVEKQAKFTGHQDCVYTLAKSDLPSVFYSSAGDGMVVKWDFAHPDQGELIARVPASVYALCYLEKENQLVIGQNFEGIHLIDLDTKMEIKSLKIADESIFDIQHYGNNLFLGLSNGSLMTVDLESFTIKNNIKFSDKSLRCIAINPISQELAAGYSDHFIRIFDLKTLGLKTEINVHTNSVFTITYSPDLRFLISGGRDAAIKVWNSTDYSLHTSIAAHLFAINHICFSPDGRYFASGSMDKSIKIWDAEDFKLLKVIDKSRHAGHGTSVNKLFWSTYHNFILSASDDRTISAWKLNFQN